MTDVLQELRDKVAAGVLEPHLVENALDGAAQWDSAIAAYHGSLDAAKALHEAVLPGWRWFLDCNGRAYVWRRSGDTRPRIAYSAHNPARAWLLAILDALIQGDKADGRK